MTLINLSTLHSFAFNYKADDCLEFNSVAELVDVAKSRQLFQQQHLILGGGSNTIFSQDFDGAVIRFSAADKVLTEDSYYYYLSVDAGHNWHELVVWAMSQGIYGLENLALIPGNVGAAPIQNIGAYGVEFVDVCDYVEYLDKDTLEIVRLDKEKLLFGYRDSLFKQALKDKTVITKVGLKLKKAWKAVNGYQGLAGLETPEAIFDGVVRQRQSKLPDHTKVPNAGSFFKNPVVTAELVEELQSLYPDMPVFPASGEMKKLSAAWLIEQCGFKGKQVGGVGVYHKHALILVNLGNGTGEQLLNLIDSIKQGVKDKFKLDLECEVQVI